MSEEPTAPAATSAATPETTRAKLPAPTDGKSGKAWKAAVGIGSAALVAALMYAGRRSLRK